MNSINSLQQIRKLIKRRKVLEQRNKLETLFTSFFEITITTLFWNVFLQGALPESWAFYPKNHIIFVAGEGCSPPRPQLIRLCFELVAYVFADSSCAFFMFIPSRASEGVGDEPKQRSLGSYTKTSVSSETAQPKKVSLTFPISTTVLGMIWV